MRMYIGERSDNGVVHIQHVNSRLQESKLVQLWGTANLEPDAARALVAESPQEEPLEVWAVHHRNALHRAEGEVLAGETETHPLLTPQYAEGLKDRAACEEEFQVAVLHLDGAEDELTQVWEHRTAAAAWES